MRHLPVNSFLGQRLFLKKLLEGLERFVPVGSPQQQQLFQRGSPMRSPVSSSSQPLLRRLMAANDARARKMFHKRQKHFVQRISTHLGAEPIEGAGHHLAVKLLPIACDQNVAGLIDQAHRVQRSGMNRQFRMLFNVAHLVHAMRKLAASRHIGKNNVPVIREERLRELIAFSCVPRNVKFHH